MITQENAKDFMPILQAIADGKLISYLDRDAKAPQRFMFEGHPNDYKIIEPPKPPKKVPLTFEDMEPGISVRVSGSVYSVSYSMDGLRLNSAFWTYKSLMDCAAEIYRPSTGKWEPAYKLQADES